MVGCLLLPERVVAVEQLALLRVVAVPVLLELRATGLLALLWPELAVAVPVHPGLCLGLVALELLTLHLQPELGVGFPELSLVAVHLGQLLQLVLPLICDCTLSHTGLVVSNFQVHLSGHGIVSYLKTLSLSSP